MALDDYDLDEGNSNKIYTTGQISKICEISTATVIRSIDNGDLEGYKIPGSNHRRVSHNSLVKFIKKYEIYEFLKHNLH